MAEPVDAKGVFAFERPYDEAAAVAIRAICDLFKFVVGEPTGCKDLESAKSIALSSVADLKYKFRSLVDIYREARGEALKCDSLSKAVDDAESKRSEAIEERDHFQKLSTILMQCLQDLADGHDPKIVADRVALYEMPRMLDLAVVIEKIPQRTR